MQFRGWKTALVVALLSGCHVCVRGQVSWDYSSILSSARDEGVQFADLPGYTRSVYKRDHALVTPESRVWAPLPGWKNALTAHIISPASSPSTNFAMYLVKLGANSATAPAPDGIERFVFVLDGAVNVTGKGAASGKELHANDYIYHPAADSQGLASDHGAGLLIYERKYALKGKPATQFGHTDDVNTLETAGEVFVLRKLLPATADYDFNIHVMDFNPGEFLNVKEIHYNQHGLLLLQGQGIYRLGDSWYPVQAGDAIWMAPYVPQWYCALGAQVSRYIIIKDTIVNPLFP